MAAKQKEQQPDFTFDVTDVEIWDIGRVIPYPTNPKIHDDHAVAEMAGMIKEFGWTYPILVDDEGVILAGHKRRKAAIMLGLSRVPVLVKQGLTSAQKRAYRIADNRLTENSPWDNSALILELEVFRDETGGLEFTGFTDADLSNLKIFEDDDEAGEGENGGASDGSLLELIDVTIDEPKHEVKPGEVWECGRHILVCAEVVDGWATWVSFLAGDETLFAPYAGPFVPLSLKSEVHQIVMVQPDPYIAGHILDRYSEVKGEDVIKRHD